MNLDLNNGIYDDLLTLEAVDGNNILDVMKGTCNVIKRAFADKMTNVFLLSMNLAQTLCTKVILAGEEPGDDFNLGFYLKKNETQPQLDGYIPQLVEKLGDANTRVTQAAGDVILSFALCPNVGASFVAQYLLRPLKARTGVKHPSRVYINRIKLLTILTEEIGVSMHGGANNDAGIHVEPLMMLSMDWFSNPNHEVRQGIVELVGVIYSKIGPEAIAPFLEELRPAQKDVFYAEFQKTERVPDDVPPQHSAQPSPGGLQQPHQGKGHAPSQSSQPPSQRKGKGRGQGSGPPSNAGGPDVHHSVDSFASEGPGGEGGEHSLERSMGPGEDSMEGVDVDGIPPGQDYGDPNQQQYDEDPGSPVVDPNQPDYEPNEEDDDGPVDPKYI